MRPMNAPPNGARNIKLAWDHSAPGQQTGDDAAGARPADDAHRGKTVRIQLFGPLSAMTFSGLNLAPRGRRAKFLLAALCVAAGKPVSRTRVAAMLWDRVPENQARASFRQALRELNLALSPG